MAYGCRLSVSLSWSVRYGYTVAKRCELEPMLLMITNR